MYIYIYILKEFIRVSFYVFLNIYLIMIHFKLKNVSVKHKGLLAPMQEYTHLPFRLLCSEYKAGLTFSEMISIHQILNFKEDLSKLDNLFSTDEEGKTAVQLFGDFSDREKTLEAVHVLDEYKYFDIIDLNFGCPSLKIINSKGGSFNLTQIDKVIPVIEELVSTTVKPITIKTRLGFSKNEIDFISSSLFKTGIAGLSIHGRLASENYSNPSNVMAVRKIKEISPIPIIYNGDVTKNNFEQYLDFDGVMVGRESLGNPFIFKQIDSFVNDKVILEKENNNDAVLRFLDLVKKHPISFAKFKTSLIHFFKDKAGSSKIREKISISKNLDGITEILNKLVNQ